MLDVAATTGELWERYLPAPVRDRLADAFGGGDPTVARRAVTLLAALHDLGKASDAFLKQFVPRYLPAATRTAWEQAFQDWQQQARAVGLPLADDLHAAPFARHEHITAARLPRLLGCTCPACGGHGPMEEEGLHTAAWLLGGHHGHVPPYATIDKAFGCAPPERWGEIYEHLVRSVAHHVGFDLDQATTVIQPRRPSALALFTGLVVLADWLASDATLFTFRALDEPVGAWWQDSLRQAQDAVEQRLLTRWQPSEQSWSDLWPGTTARPFQIDALDLLPAQGQAMVIIESDTGSGKTRAALATAHHLTRTNGYTGLYLAMPTRAAARQGGHILREFINNAAGEADALPLALVHGTAAADDLTHQLLDAERPAGDATDDLAAFVRGTCITSQDPHRDDTPAHAVLNPWYLRRCLGLIATFGVGTVDQVVLAAQRSRHWFLRLFGLACKVVIIDEAHAYELYQQDLFSAAVEWLADAGASVVVLSATLPTAVHRALADAWRRGLGTPTDHPEQGQGPITVIDRHGATRRGGPLPDRVDTILHTRLDLIPDPGTEQLAQRLIDQARDGGCIAALRTRVGACADLHETVLRRALQQGWQEEEVVLLHGGMLSRDRLPIEARLTALLGPGPDARTRNPDRPHRLLVIATSVLEQSLDLDFDRMYSDLAPIDLIIQRRGRLHRHSINDPHRPARMSEPRLTVLWRPDRDGRPVVEAPDNPDAYVHPPYLLAAAWTSLTQRARGTNRTVRIHTPHDSRKLIEESYGSTTTGTDVLLERTRAGWHQALEAEAAEADKRVLHPYRAGRRGRRPLTPDDLASGASHGDGEQGGTTGIAARSRLGEDTIDILLLYRQPSGELTYDPDGNHRADLRHHTGRDRTNLHAWRTQQKDFLLNTLALPHRWFTGRQALPHPDKWERLPHKALKDQPVALLDPQGACVHGPIGRLSYRTNRGPQRSRA